MNLDDIIKMSKKELLDIRGFGEKSYIELCDKLKDAGFQYPEESFEGEG